MYAVGNEAFKIAFAENRDKEKRLRPRKRIKLKSVIETLESYGLDPIKEILQILQSDRIDDDLKIKTWIELTNYCHPKLKSVEVTGDRKRPLAHDVSINITPEEAYKMIIDGPVDVADDVDRDNE